MRANGNVAETVRRRESEDAAGSEREIMNLHDVAEYLRCHETTVRRMLGRNPAFRACAFRLGSDYRFRRRDLETWAINQSVTE